MVSRYRKTSTDSGSSMVEFAVIVPVFAFLIFGVIQFGLILSAYITVRNASAIGARCAAISGPACVAQAQDAVGPMLKPNLASATVSNAVVGGENAFQVEVQYPLPLLIPFVVPGSAGSTLTLRGITIAR